VVRAYVFFEIPGNEKIRQKPEGKPILCCTGHQSVMVQVETLRHGQITVVVMPQRCDSYVAMDVDRALKEVISEGTGMIVCDFSKTEYVSSGLLRVLLGSQKNLKKRGGNLTVAALSSYVLEVFETTGFTRIFFIYTDTDEALTALGR
jgi:anti-sigma B factor antagonist